MCDRDKYNSGKCHRLLPVKGRLSREKNLSSKQSKQRKDVSNNISSLFFADLRRLHFKLDSLQKWRSKVGLIYVLIRLLSGRMPLTFNSVKNLCLASGYSLSLFVGTPINVYIIYRLSSKDVKKSNYFRLLILMCLIDVYQAVFGELDFWGEIIVIHSVP